MAYIQLRKFGPVFECQMEVRPFTVLTGPQASGKSTIAKAIFFFRTVAQDFIDQIQTRTREDVYHTTFENDLKKRLRSKFLQMFGSSWSMPLDMGLHYEYSKGVAIDLCLKSNAIASVRNFIDFSFSDAILEFIKQYEDYTERGWDEDSWQKLQQEIQALFSDGYDTIYIPAGRSLATLLTDQLMPLLSSEGRSLDFCMQSYVQKISSIRPQIGGGLSDLLDSVLHTTQLRVNQDALRRLTKLMQGVLHARYVYDRGEEKLFFDEDRYVKINFASSGQQESVWVFNLLYFHLVKNRKIFLIMEEPEAHLYPDSQKRMAEAIGLFAHEGNQVLVTTHSPYILGQFNNMLYAGELQERAGERYEQQLHDVLHPLSYLSFAETRAVHVHDGTVEDAVRNGLICNELIDDASKEINEETDALMTVEAHMDEDVGDA